MLQRTFPAGFIAPCLPTKTDKLPSGSEWLHEIKHDGFRIIARKNGPRVRLYSRPGNDLTYRFPLIVEALARLRSRSCIIDGEAVACDDNGVASFNLVRYRHHDESIFLYAFDLIELNGDDLRRDPVPTANPKQLTDARESVDSPIDERSLQIDLVRLDRTVPVAGSVGSRNPCSSTSAQHPAAQIPEASGPQ
jgi:ATP dependent DNA ligase domain